MAAPPRKAFCPSMPAAIARGDLAPNTTSVSPRSNVPAIRPAAPIARTALRISEALHGEALAIHELLRGNYEQAREALNLCATEETFPRQTQRRFASARKSRAANSRDYKERPAGVAKRRQRAWPGEYGGFEKLYGDRGDVSVSSVQDHRFQISIQFPLTGASSLVSQGARR